MAIWTPGDPTLPDSTDPMLRASAAGYERALAAWREQHAEPEPLTEYAGRPNEFWVEMLERRPWKGEAGVPGQYELNQALADGERFIDIFAGTGGGKTYWVGATIVYFVTTQRDSIVIPISKSWAQVIHQVFAEVRKAWAVARRNAPRLLGRELPGRCLATRIEIGPKWFVLPLSPQDPENVAGFHPDRELSEEVKANRDRWLEMSNAEFFAAPTCDEAGQGMKIMAVQDECSRIPDETSEAINGILTTPNSYRLRTGNLTRIEGVFHDAYQGNPPRTPNRLCYPEEEADEQRERREARIRELAGQGAGETSLDGDALAVGLAASTVAARRREGADTLSVRWTAFDAPVVDREWIDLMRRECGGTPDLYERHPAYQVRVLAQPPSDSAMQVFPASLLVSCSELRPGSGGRHMSVDLGFGGGDPCVAGLWVNGRLSSMYVWNYRGAVVEAPDSARVIARLANDWKVDQHHVHVDATGAGQPVCQMLSRYHGLQVDAVNLGAKPAGDWAHTLGPTPLGIKTRRQELHWIARRLLEEGLLAIPEVSPKGVPSYAPVWRELQAIHWSATGGAGDYVVERKDKTVERLGHSPDHADMVILGVSRTGGRRHGVVVVPRRGRLVRVGPGGRMR